MWWKMITINHVWICQLYLCVALVYALLLFRRRRKLQKLVTGMEKRTVGETSVYVTDTPVTPATIGVFRPRVVMPEAILKEYTDKEIQTILLHEKTHIQLGHLLFYLLWDVVRVLLWLNPLLLGEDKKLISISTVGIISNSVCYDTNYQISFIMCNGHIRDKFCQIFQ